MILVVCCALPGPGVIAAQVAPVPVPPGQVATAGPWQVLTVRTGEEAATEVGAASPANPAPADGEQFVVVELTATNGGDRPLSLDPGDFAVIGAGWVGRASDLVAPEPALAGTVEPGAVITGSVALPAPIGDGAMVLL